jgi:hypothetical protein
MPAGRWFERDRMWRHNLLASLRLAASVPVLWFDDYSSPLLASLTLAASIPVLWFDDYSSPLLASLTLAASIPVLWFDDCSSLTACRLLATVSASIIRWKGKFRSLCPLHHLTLQYVPLRPPLWSSRQSSWLLIQRSRFLFPSIRDFLSSSWSH